METEPRAAASTCTGAGQSLSKAHALSLFLGAILSGLRWPQIYRVSCFWRDDREVLLLQRLLSAAPVSGSLQNKT